MGGLLVGTTPARCVISPGASSAALARLYPLSVTGVDLRSEEGRRLAADAGGLFAPGVLVDERPFSYGRLFERKLRRLLDRRTAMR